MIPTPSSWRRASPTGAPLLSVALLLALAVAALVPSPRVLAAAATSPAATSPAAHAAPAAPASPAAPAPGAAPTATATTAPAPPLAPSVMSTGTARGPGAAAPATSRPARDPLADLPTYGDSLKRMFWSLLAIIAGLIFVGRVLPRLLGRPRFGPRGKMITVIESHRLEPNKSVYLVRVADQFFLLGATGDRLEVLSGAPLDPEKTATAIEAAERAPASAAAPPAPPIKSFADLLRGKRS